MTSNLLFGSIGVLVETSELQRQSFNRALTMNGVDWNWNIGTYCDLLKEPGGKKDYQNIPTTNSVLKK